MCHWSCSKHMKQLPLLPLLHDKPQHTAATQQRKNVSHEEGQWLMTCCAKTLPGKLHKAAQLLLSASSQL